MGFGVEGMDLGFGVLGIGLRVLRARHGFHMTQEQPRNKMGTLLAERSLHGNPYPKKSGAYKGTQSLKQGTRAHFGSWKCLGSCSWVGFRELWSSRCENRHPQAPNSSP